jgi:hypothetical protein
MYTLSPSPEVAPIRPILDYLVRLWSIHTQVDIRITTNPSPLTIGTRVSDTIRVSEAFIKQDFSNPTFSADCLLTNTDGSPDYLFTAFYMLNSLQEYNSPPDELGRFQYKHSYQATFGKAHENIVQRCFDALSKRIGLSYQKQKSRFFLTHDIDMVYGAWLEDGFNVLKKGRIDQFLKLIMHVAMQKPDWLNIDQIMKLESEYDCRSVFFWIVNKGVLNAREENADYDFRSKKIQQHFQAVAASGFENGIHKSLSPDTFQEEFKKYGSMPVSNRYHYLKFNLPSAYQTMDNAGLKLDASVGFAQEPGFRNSYGLPFTPYNLVTQRPFSFVEVPLHVMDRTFFQYKRSSIREAEEEIFQFFEVNKEHCVLSVLWHNNFFTNYKFKGYLDLYKKILAYIRDNKLSTISQEDIIKQYSIG